MSGLWSQSFSTVQDLNGKPIVGAKAFFYAAATSTPLATFKDYGLTTPNPNPVSTDGYGRWPAVFLDEDDDFFRARVTTPGGVIIFDADNVPIIGPSGGGGGAPPSPVDPNAILKTGDIKARYGEGFLDGYVRCNGRSIGTATSGADERANSDVMALYEFLWNADPNLTVAGGRGANAAADWGANKPLSLPDFRGRAIVGLDDMGNVPAGVVTDLTDLGKKTGAQSVTLTVEQIPSHSHDITINNEQAHKHQLPRSTSSGDPGQVGFEFGAYSGPGEFTLAGQPHTHTATIAAKGGGAAHSNVQPSLGITVYIRL